MQLYLITVKSQDFQQLDEVYCISLIAISFLDFLNPVFLFYWSGELGGWKLPVLLLSAEVV